MAAVVARLGPTVQTRQTTPRVLVARVERQLLVARVVIHPNKAAQVRWVKEERDLQVPKM